MQRGHILGVTAVAAAELARQAAFAGTPGLMHIDLVHDTSGQGWQYIRIRPGKHSGVPLARVDGVTLFAPQDQIEIFAGLSLSYFGDLSGGGFLISSPVGTEGSACGSGFRYIN